MICVIATIKAKTGQRQALLACIQENLPNVHAEVGCLEYLGFNRENVWICYAQIPQRTR